MASFDLESYATVQERIAQFYQDFPDGNIQTFLVVRDGPEVIFEARVFRNPEEFARGSYTSGFAREVEGSGKGPINRTSHLENGESSSIGRALANLGYATDARRPSRSEMLKVARQKEDHEEAIQFIRLNGPRLTDLATIAIEGQTHNLKDYVRKNWGVIKERIVIALKVREAIEEQLKDQELVAVEVGE